MPGSLKHTAQTSTEVKRLHKARASCLPEHELRKLQRQVVLDERAARCRQLEQRQTHRRLTAKHTRQQRVSLSSSSSQARMRDSMGAYLQTRARPRTRQQEPEQAQAGQKRSGQEETEDAEAGEATEGGEEGGDEGGGEREDEGGGERGDEGGGEGQIEHQEAGPNKAREEEIDQSRRTDALTTVPDLGNAALGSSGRRHVGIAFDSSPPLVLAPNPSLGVVRAEGGDETRSQRLVLDGDQDDSAAGCQSTRHGKPAFLACSGPDDLASARLHGPCREGQERLLSQLAGPVAQLLSTDAPCNASRWNPPTSLLYKLQPPGSAGGLAPPHRLRLKRGSIVTLTQDAPTGARERLAAGTRVKVVAIRLGSLVVCEVDPGPMQGRHVTLARCRHVCTRAGAAGQSFTRMQYPVSSVLDVDA